MIATKRNLNLTRCAVQVRGALILAALFATSAIPAHAQVPGAVAGQDDKPVFPLDPSSWVNSGPVNLASLKGKGVVLIYFEEDCPRCRGGWPERLALAQKYADQPVLFMAVNSGNARQAVQQYARETRLNWPILVDSNRQFEKASDVGELSLRNIIQVTVIKPNGKMQRANWDDIDGAAKLALQGATWKIDPKEIPPAMKSAWSAVEFNNFVAGAVMIKKGLTSPAKETKTAAELLMAEVKKEMDAELALAKEAADKGDNWNAFKLYTKFAERFRGYDLPEEVEATRKTLSTNEEVKKNQLALKNLEGIRKLLVSPNAATQKRGVQQLKKLAEDSPDTEAGKNAQTLLGTLGVK